MRELRNNGGAVLDRVARGARVLVTRDGADVAELRPLPRTTPPTHELIARRRNLPRVTPAALRRDVDAVVDQSW